MTNKSNILWHW